MGVEIRRRPEEEVRAAAAVMERTRPGAVAAGVEWATRAVVAEGAAGRWIRHPVAAAERPTSSPPQAAATAVDPTSKLRTIHACIASE